METLRKLDRLEERITEAIGIIAQWKSRCDVLERRSAELERDVKILREENAALSVKVHELETMRQDGNGIVRHEVLNKIDRMLEKFGELQI